MNKTILFDLDGTLIDSTPAILEGFDVCFNENSIPVPNEDKILSLIGHPLDVMFIELGIEEKKIEKFVISYKQHYRKISNQMTTLLPNAKEAIELANSFATIGVVTTKTGRYSDELLIHLGVRKYFKILIGREDVINPKPHAEPILKALTHLKANKESSFMIGDTNLDIESSFSAGIKPIGVLTGYDKNMDKHNIILKKDSLGAVKYIKEIF